MIQEIKNEINAKQLEQMLYKKLSIECSMEDGGLGEYALELFDDGDIDSIYDYETMTTELMALCLHPEVQKHIPEWLKPDIGKRLLKLHQFFKLLDWKTFHLYMAYTKIKSYGYRMTKEEIEGFETYYLKEN